MDSCPKPRSACPVVFALDLFGDKWTLLIIRDMALLGRSSYTEFLAAGEGISTNILAHRLKRLEAAQIVRKERHPEHGAKFRYTLTPKGLDLIPVLVEMLRWSARHDPESPVPQELRQRLEDEPRAVAEEMRRRTERD